MTQIFYTQTTPLINRYVNHDLDLVAHWFRANRVSLNVDEIEIVIFWRKRNQIKYINFRISRQKIKPKAHKTSRSNIR